MPRPAKPPKASTWRIVRRTPAQTLAILNDIAIREFPETVAAMNTDQLGESLDVLHALMQTVQKRIDVLYEQLSR